MNDNVARVAFVTGVSRGLGEAFAGRLVADGWMVYGIGRHKAGPPASPRFESVHADLSDLASAMASVAAAMHRGAARKPTRAVLVNNAAIAGPVGRLGALRQDEVTESLNVNLVAPTVLANAFCEAFGDPGCDRRIINVSSGLASRAIAATSLYSVAKCGMEMLTRALAVDHPEPSFAAVTFRPGVIDTAMQTYLRSHSAKALPDVTMFQRFHDSGELVAAATVAAVGVTALVDGVVRSGATYNFGELAAAKQ